MPIRIHYEVITEFIVMNLIRINFIYIKAKFFLNHSKMPAIVINKLIEPSIAINIRLNHIYCIM